MEELQDEKIAIMDSRAVCRLIECATTARPDRGAAGHNSLRGHSCAMVKS